MNGYRLATSLGVIVLVALVGAMAYNTGVSQGIARSGKMPVMSAPATGPVAAPYPYPYPYPYYWGWHPFGFGFFIPFLFLFLIFGALRAAFWRARWHAYGGCRGYQERFDEWHRQSHERMKGA
jgi:hypothetical protein